MTETTTLTPVQEACEKLGTSHPSRQILCLLARIEKLEGKKELKVESKELEKTEDGSRSEKMKAYWAAKKAKKEETING